MKDVRLSLARWMFCSALNYRFHRISKQTDRPFFSCSTYTEDFVRPAMGYIIEANCPEGGTILALEQMLIEVRYSLTHFVNLINLSMHSIQKLF